MQLAGIFILLFFATLGLSYVINGLFLQNYYEWKKQSQIERAYTSVGQLLSSYDSGSEDFRREISKLASDGNMSIVVADSSFDIIYSTVNESQMMISRLARLIFGSFGEDERGGPGKGDPEREKRGFKSKVLAQTDRYVITLSTDPMVSADYIELWGTFGESNIVFIRTPLESIRESVDISNRFLFYIALCMTILGGMIIWLVARKITKPVLELSRLSDRMAHLDFDAKYAGGGKNELGDLGEHMNEMSDQLERTISELKTANNELQRDIEKKEKMETMRGEFISNVSHELKTPIALIQGYAEGLKDNVNDDPESRDFYCDVIIDEADKMNRLVKNLLTLNQLEFGAEQIRLERFDITELIRNSLQASDIMLKQYGATAGFDGTEPVWVWGDEFKVEEVFSNFLSNAVHYCSGEKRIEISLLKENGKVRVSVFNTGNPIPEESIPQLWDKFYKVDKARTREVGGSGVGLSIVKAIMEAMNNPFGVVNYENGVSFWFELDAAETK